MKISIIILEKEIKLSLAIKHYFINTNIEIRPTTTKKKAWNELLNEPPDLMIVDSILPKTEGYDLIKTVKKNEKFTQIPYIVLTINGLTEDRIESYKFGCNGYISKPFDPLELKSIVYNLLETKKKTLQWIEKTYSIVKNLRIKINESQEKQFPKLNLTKQEKLIVKKLFIGKTNKDISKELAISQRTIENSMSKLFNRTGTKNRYELIKMLTMIIR